MPENNPFKNSNQKPPNSDGILDIDKIIEQEKIHAHTGAAPEPVAAAKPPTLPSVEERPEVESLPEVKTVPAVEEYVDDEPSQDEFDEPELEPEPEPDPEPAEDITTWQPPSRRIPRVERPTIDQMDESVDEVPVAPEEPNGDIILGTPKNTLNRRNLLLITGAAIAVIGLIFLIPRLIESGILFKSSDTGTTPSGSDSSAVTAGLSKDVKMKKVSDGLEADDPDVWEATFTIDTTDITLSVDCTPKAGGGTSPNLSCVGAAAGGVADGTFVKPFTAGEGWTYDGPDYGYCFSFANKVSAKTVQSDLYGSSGIQLFYLADDFKICSKKAGDPNNKPKGSKCDSQTYCPAVRLRSIS
jgi:hypothetical protein